MSVWLFVCQYVSGVALQVKNEFVLASAPWAPEPAGEWACWVSFSALWRPMSCNGEGHRSEWHIVK